MNAANLENLERWWALSLYDVIGDAPFKPIVDYAYDNLPVFAPGDVPREGSSFVDDALRHLAGQLHTCRAKCPSQLRRWAYRKIDKIAAKLNKRDKADPSDDKPFVYEQHGDRCFVQLFDAKGNQHIWKFPVIWLEQARLVWPVYVRHFPDGRPYLARKTPITQPDGARVQVEAVVHRLFLGLGAIRHDVIDSAEAETRDGSWLNFCDDNIRLIKGTDLLANCRCTIYERTTTKDWTPAKAKVTTSHEGSLKKDSNWHEKSVLKFLSGKHPGEQEIIPKT